MFFDLMEIDHSILLAINSAPLGTFGHLLIGITDLHKSPFFVVILVGILLGYAFRRKAFKWIFFLVLWIGLGDFLGGRIKDSVGRPRPDLQGIEVHLRCAHAGGGSFPSNHTLNNFALWALLYFSDKGRKHYFILLLANLIAWSRRYCGVHFPSDVLGGVLLGVGWGYLGFWVWQKGISLFLRNSRKSSSVD